MAIVEIINNPLNTEGALYNLCKYIIKPKKTENGYYTGARGISVAHAYEDIVEMQTLYQNTGGRRGYHITVSFSPEDPLSPHDVWNIAYLITNLFFPEYQVLYGMHTDEDHLHIHLGINTVSMRTGKKLHIDYGMLYWMRKEIDHIVERHRMGESRSVET